MIGDGISLGGDKDWCRAVAALAKKVHASVGEFEEVVTGVVEELARPCRERTADLIGWTHCLAVTGLLLENAESYRRLQGKAMEPVELLHSLLLPAVNPPTRLPSTLRIFPILRASCRDLVLISCRIMITGQAHSPGCSESGCQMPRPARIG